MSNDADHQFLDGVFGDGVPFNSNNAWGFGGGIGTKWEADGVVVKLFKACFRHLPGHKVITVTIDRRRVFDAHDTKKSRKAGIEMAVDALAERRAKAQNIQNIPKRPDPDGVTAKDIARYEKGQKMLRDRMNNRPLVKP